MLRQQDILGAWALSSWTITLDDSRPGIEPFGSGATGRIHYAPDGFMSATIMRPARTELDPVRSILKSYMHYTGRFHLEGDDVVHCVDFALDPALIGHELRRNVHLDGDVLTLTGVDDTKGGRRTHVVRWTRSA